MAPAHARGGGCGSGRGRSSFAGMGAGADAGAWPLLNANCARCTKWGASPGAGVIGGYGGVTEGLRGAFFDFSGGFVQYCGGGVFWLFPEKCSKFLRGCFWAVGGNVFKIVGLHFFDILNTLLKMIGGADAQFFDILNTAPEIVGVRVCTFLTF